MKIVKITFSDGDYTITRISGTEKQIRNYYSVGRAFTRGYDDGTGWHECKHFITGIEFLG